MMVAQPEEPRVGVQVMCLPIGPMGEPRVAHFAVSLLSRLTPFRAADGFRGTYHGLTG